MWEERRNFGFFSPEKKKKKGGMCEDDRIDEISFVSIAEMPFLLPRTRSCCCWEYRLP